MIWDVDNSRVGLMSSRSSLVGSPWLPLFCSFSLILTLLSVRWQSHLIAKCTVIHSSPSTPLLLSSFLSSIFIHVCSFLPFFCPLTSHLMFITLILTQDLLPPLPFFSVPFHSPYLTLPHSINVQLFREVVITPVCFVLCLCPDSQPECPLHLWSAVELLSAKQQQQQPWPQCASWIETLPYKALGTVASANFFFFSAKRASLSAPHLLGRDGRPLHSLFWFLLHTSEEDPASSRCASPQRS